MERTDNVSEKYTLQRGTGIAILFRLKLMMYGAETVAESPHSQFRGNQNKKESR
jgi:hypothetical protein